VHVRRTALAAEEVSTDTNRDRGIRHERDQLRHAADLTEQAVALSARCGALVVPLQMLVRRSKQDP
jgi:hypothetical protein